MLVIPRESTLYATLEQAAQSKRMIFLVGLPGTGKSLLIQQLSLIANGVGRTVHLMQYDMARSAFESAKILAKYPETDGVTHPMVRKAVGLWSREAVQSWHQQNGDPTHLLIGELPLIGNRLIELVQPLADRAEALLAGEKALFLIAVPSVEVRAVIEKARTRTIADPQHEKETLDAPPHVLQALWQEMAVLAQRLGLIEDEQPIAYSPSVYARTFEALLQQRNCQTLRIEDLLQPVGSVYELDVVASELRANASDAARILREIEDAYTPAELEESVARWYAYVEGGQLLSN